MFKIILLLVVAAVQADPRILSAILASSGLSAPVGIASLATDTKAMSEGLDLAGNLTEYATKLVANASGAATHVARVGLKSTTQLGKKALKGGVEVAKQGLGFAKTVGKHMPGYSRVINAGSTVANTSLKVVDKLGEKGLDLVEVGGDKLLEVSNKLVGGGAEKINTIAQSGISFGKKVVGKVDQVKTNTVDRLQKLKTNALNRIPGGFLFNRNQVENY